MKVFNKKNKSNIILNEDQIFLLQKELFNLSFKKNLNVLKNFNLISKYKSKIGKIKFNNSNNYDTNSN